MLKKMGAQPGDLLDDGSFSLTNHLEENFTSKESVDRIANHVAAIRQQYPPLDINSLPLHVKDKLVETSEEFGVKPLLEEYQVDEMIRKAKKPKSGIPGDLPRSLVQEFSPEKNDRHWSLALTMAS